jgi:hypothetical protein
MNENWLCSRPVAMARKQAMSRAEPELNRGARTVTAPRRVGAGLLSASDAAIRDVLAQWVV